MENPHFAVITADKQTGSGGGLSAHIDREVWDETQQKMVPYIPHSVSRPERAVLNKEYILKPGEGRTTAIENRIRAAGVTRSIRKDQVKALTFICTSDHEKMAEIEASGRLDEWVADTLQWFYDYFGKENVVAAALHMDEKTPHLHVTVVPIVQGAAKERKPKPKLDEDGKPIEIKKRRYKKQTVTARLCAADVMKQSEMSKWQASYPQAMKKWGMVRGIEGHGVKRVDPATYNRNQQLEARNEELTEKNAKLKRENAGLQVANSVGGAAVAVGQTVAGWFGQSAKDETIKAQERQIEALQETLGQERGGHQAELEKVRQRAKEARSEASAWKGRAERLQSENYELEKKLSLVEKIEKAFDSCCSWAAKCARGKAVWQWVYEKFEALCDAEGINETWANGRHSKAAEVWLTVVDPDNRGRAYGQFTEEQQQQLSDELHKAADHPELGRGEREGLKR